MPWRPNSLILASDAADITSKSGSSNTCKVAYAHAVLLMSWTVNSEMIVKAA
eukprot:CAMPEP_0203937018 /NCGR_PEP_ID=MMETSP0359-20131031/74384_1 /ASSEMBLY_ACC=CAM_ASM_000338 /TAXON_ID=268821 /ORGANISM="Scrippsiella Hangoei, Strain SHTV-5" /LENGTH=51 /DNA_ID=CAMNT_0050867051 /DNA_START=73 /DNA_END=224 /DNA_ORIENTATION=-